jgi:hypothetical protein
MGWTGYPIEPLQCLDEKPTPGPQSKAADPLQAPDEDHAPAVRCANCLGSLTDEHAAIDVTGQHTHMCMNPHGLFFRVACFKRAPGCDIQGLPEHHWSWFTGYAWQIAACVACTNHIGWRFTDGETVFFGLIEDRILRGHGVN